MIGTYSLNCITTAGGNVERLLDSKGNHITNISGERLYATSGQNIGRRISNGSFVDISGKYFGKVVSVNRLLYCLDIPYQNINYGNAGNAENPGNPGAIGTISGFVDADKNKLRNG